MKCHRLESVVPPPDGTLAARTETSAVMTDDKSEYLTHIFLGKTDGSKRIRLTRGGKSAHAPQFSPDGEWVYFTPRRKRD